MSPPVRSKNAEARHRNLLLRLSDLHLDFSRACGLTVREHRLLGMSLGQRSRSSGIAEVRRPLPVPDLGHILKVFANVVVVFVQLPVE